MTILEITLHLKAAKLGQYFRHRNIFPYFLNPTAKIHLGRAIHHKNRFSDSVEVETRDDNNLVDTWDETLLA